MRKLDDLWHTRQQQHLIQQSKYLRYVFNDHLMIAVIFLCGALAYWYSQQLRLISRPLWWAPVIVVVLLMLGLSVGHLATLFQSADQIFLLPAEERMRSYLLKARHYSLLLPIFTLIAVAGILTPFVLRATSLTTSAWALTLICLLILKDLDLWLQLFRLFDFPIQQKQRLNWLFWGIALVSLWLCLLGFGWLMVLILLALDLLMMTQQKRLLQPQRLMWRDAINRENSRQMVINRFYNLFVDVPGISSAVHRRKWLDPIAKLLAGQKNNAFRYLFSRAFIRGSEYSNIWLRFCIVGVVLIFAVKQPVVLLITVILFLFLTGYQLLPLYHHFDYNALTAIFPLTPEIKQTAFIQVLTRVLAIEWFVDSVAILISLAAQLWSLIIIGAALVMLIVFLKIYLPARLKRQQKGFN